MTASLGQWLLRLCCRAACWATKGNLCSSASQLASLCSAAAEPAVPLQEHCLLLLLPNSRPAAASEELRPWRHSAHKAQHCLHPCCALAAAHRRKNDWTAGRPDCPASAGCICAASAPACCSRQSQAVLPRPQKPEEPTDELSDGEDAPAPASELSASDAPASGLLGKSASNACCELAIGGPVAAIGGPIPAFGGPAAAGGGPAAAAGTDAQACTIASPSLVG